MICCTICIFWTIGMITQTEYGVGIDLWMFFIETKKLWAIVHFFKWFIEHDLCLFFEFFEVGLKGIPVWARLSYILYILLLFFPRNTEG